MKENKEKNMKENKNLRTILFKFKNMGFMGLCLLASTVFLSTLVYAKPKKQIDKVKSKSEFKKSLPPPLPQNSPSQKLLYWYDGKIKRQIRQENSIYAVFSKSVGKNSFLNIVAKNKRKLMVSSSSVAIIKTQSPGKIPIGVSREKLVPVFRSLSGQLMTLPGGVILLFKKKMTEKKINNFFIRKKIPKNKIKKDLNLPNYYFVETKPGLPSLKLANKLRNSSELLSSSPNWWRRVERK